MKTKRYITIIAVTAMFVLGSCNKFLDTLPDNRTEIDSEEKVTKLLVSAYPRTLTTYLSEMSSDNCDFNGSNYNQYHMMQEEIWSWGEVTASGSDSPYYLWNECYIAIANANLALESIEKMGNPESLQPQRGEALMCRAFAHFQLATIFCMPYDANAATNLGIPYMYGLETTVLPHYDRGTVKEVYDNIGKDIAEGLPLIDDAIYSRPKTHFNRAAANAFAARYYLFVRDYDKVIEHADRVLGEVPEQSMLQNWTEMGSIAYGERAKTFVSSSESANLLIISAWSIWNRVQRSNYVRYGHNRAISSYESYGAPGVWGSAPDFHLIAYLPVGNPSSHVQKMQEYAVLTGVNTVAAYQILPVFNTNKLLLERAEAYIMRNGAGDLDKAVRDMQIWLDNYSKSSVTLTRQLVNDTYGQMNYYEPLTPTPKKRLNPDFTVEPGEQENFVHCILHMRRVQNIHEGDRWHDVKRYGITIHRRSVTEESGTEVWDELKKNDPRRAIQLPQEVRTAGMTPNPR